jgi:hypothetical protein
MGYKSREIILILLSLIFAASLFYCFLAVFILSILHRKTAAALSSRIVPQKIPAGGKASIFINDIEDNKRIFIQAPGVLVRYEIDLSTKDGKRIRQLFSSDIWKEKEAVFSAPMRGAYFGACDKIKIFDVFGFFSFMFNVVCEKTERLLVRPRIIEDAPSVKNYVGGAEKRSDNQIVRTDDLIDQRPYIPGDDPRRINWKLYGHSGGLFVREEDREPPPHSVLFMLLCTETSGSRDGIAAVDSLCDAAFAIARDNSEFGIDIFLGSNGMDFQGGDLETISTLLSYPFAIHCPNNVDFELPLFNNEKRLLILALPCIGGSLDRFISKKNASQKIEILFIYNDDDEPAKDAAKQYSRMEGVSAKAIKL